MTGAADTAMERSAADRADESHGAPAGAESPWPSAAARYYALGILTIAYVLAFIDRTIMSILVGPLKSDLHLSDTQVGLLNGLAFAIFYALMGLPLGFIIDRYPRKLVIAGGIALWSVVTATCGLAGNFVHLFVSRMGVGVGEAVLSPGAYSLMSDFFKPTERNRAAGIYTLGVSIGAALAYLAGGMIIQFAHKGGPLHLPLLGELAPWRFAFVIVGIPGLIVALLMLTVPEPLRRKTPSLKPQAPAEGQISLRAFLVSSWKPVLTCLLGYSLLNVPFVTVLQWGPAFFMRHYHLNPGQVGLILGCIFLGPSLLGQLFGGWLSDFRFGRGSKASVLQTAMICGLLLAPISAASMIVPSLTWSVILVGAMTFLVCASVGHGPASLTMISPGHLRGQMTAVYFIVIQILVLSFAGLLVALISDHILHDPARINVGMSIVSGVASLLGAIVLAAGMNSFSRAVTAHGGPPEPAAA
jgi:MFS family permease